MQKAQPNMLILLPGNDLASNSEQHIYNFIFNRASLSCLQDLPGSLHCWSVKC
jgi:hypothetical protein